MSDTTGLAELLVETGRAHHRAFIETDGVDPEWPLWYAEYLIEPLRGRGYAGTQAELVAALVGADRVHRAEAADTPWPEFYAGRLLPT